MMSTQLCDQNAEEPSMALSWIKKVKIRLRHWRVSRPEQKRLRIDFDEIVESGWPDPPLNRNKKPFKISNTNFDTKKISLKHQDHIE